MIMEAIKSLNVKTIEVAEKPHQALAAVPAKATKQKLFSPRKVEDQMNQFGVNMNRLQAEDDQVFYSIIDKQ